MQTEQNKPGLKAQRLSPNHVYVILEWQEQGPMEANGQRMWQQNRRVCTVDDYPDRLACHNPNCQNGGFEIGDKIIEFLNSGKESAQNSLICNNAVRQGRSSRCLHTILYSLTRVLPYDRAKRR